MIRRGTLYFCEFSHCAQIVISVILFAVVLNELGLPSVDNLILSFPLCPDDELTLSRLQPVWEEMEQLAAGGMAKNIGVADLFRAHLKELHDWSKVKPTIDQVNLAHCCTIPEVSLDGDISSCYTFLFSAIHVYMHCTNN